jgi:hypothetical protein
MDEPMIREWYKGSPDVQLYSYTSELTGLKCLLIYCEGLCDIVLISDLVLPELQLLSSESIKTNRINQSLGPIMFSRVDQPWKEDECSTYIFSGRLLIYFPEEQVLLRINLEKKPRRQPEESAMENSTLGPRDGFIEELSTNVALIRKRLRTNQLHFEVFVVGNHKTEVALLYMEGIKNRPYLLDARKQLATLNLDSLTAITQLSECMTNSPYSLFPLFSCTGRPDFAADCLLHDRFVIIVDGNPAVLIAPANLFLLLKSPEDIYVSYGTALIGRLVRLIGLWLTISLPGFWVAITQFNQDQLPVPLLATITMARGGLPLSATLEMMLSLFFLELFREAGSRLPQSIGQPITVVGGLIIGDAAIRAGLISPSIVVITGLTAVTAATLANLNLSGNATVLRLIIVALSAFLGLFGFMISVLAMMWYLLYHR